MARPVNLQGGGWIDLSGCKTIHSWPMRISRYDKSRDIYLQTSSLDPWIRLAVVASSFSTGSPNASILRAPNGALILSYPTKVGILGGGRDYEYHLLTSTDAVHLLVEQNQEKTAQELFPKEYSDWRRSRALGDAGMAPRTITPHLPIATTVTSNRGFAFGVPDGWSQMPDYHLRDSIRAGHLDATTVLVAAKDQGAWLAMIRVQEGDDTNWDGDHNSFYLMAASSTEQMLQEVRQAGAEVIEGPDRIVVGGKPGLTWRTASHLSAQQAGRYGKDVDMRAVNVIAPHADKLWLITTTGPTEYEQLTHGAFWTAIGSWRWLSSQEVPSDEPEGQLINPPLPIANTLVGNGFTVGIPPGWSEIPAADLSKVKRIGHGTPPAFAVQKADQVWLSIIWTSDLGGGFRRDYSLGRDFYPFATENQRSWLESYRKAGWDLIQDVDRVTIGGHPAVWWKIGTSVPAGQIGRSGGDVYVTETCLSAFSRGNLWQVHMQSPRELDVTNMAVFWTMVGSWKWF